MSKNENSNYFSMVSSIVVYFFLFVFGSLRDNFGKLTGISRYAALLAPQEDISSGQKTAWDSQNNRGKQSEAREIVVPRTFPQLLRTQEGFFTRRIFHRLRDCFDRPICSAPGAHIRLLPRYTEDNQKSMHVPDEYLGRYCEFSEEQEKNITTGLNLGSYNYLGFADHWKEICGPDVLPVLREMGPVATSTSLEAGFTNLHKQLEDYVAKYLHKEKALVFSMGYGTNQTVLSALLGQDSVVISDKLNHASIVNGCRGGMDTKILPFKHNDATDLEKTLQMLLLCGQDYPSMPASGADYRPWGKMVVVVEGIYSMEGDICRLPDISRVCKKYKAFVYLDEAHSIGAMGATGRGVCEHTGVDFSQVDILMGTFSKSFAGMGGYVAASADIIDKLRATCSGQTSMSPLSTTVTKQVLTAFRVIDSPEGQRRIKNLHENANYMRKKLKLMGLTVLGDNDSPIIPVMLYQFTKITAFSREMIKRGLAVVVVGFPATPVYEARVRFCLSAGHDRDDIKNALKEVATVSKMHNLRYERSMFG